MVELKILRVSKRVLSKLSTLDFWRADFKLFLELLGRVTWDKALEGRGAQESWSVFRNHLQDLKQFIPRKKKVGKNARRINKELLDLLCHKKKVYREWKQE